MSLVVMAHAFNPRARGRFECKASLVTEKEFQDSHRTIKRNPVSKQTEKNILDWLGIFKVKHLDGWW